MIVLQKKAFPILLILIFIIIASLKLLTPFFYTSHDGEGHVIRMEEFHQALEDGQFPVRIAKRINAGLGYPFFNFNYPLVYILGELFYRLSFSFVNSFKACLLLSLMVGGFSIYFYCRLFFGKIASLGSVLFFLFVPYRFLNIYVRGDVAESLGLGFLTLCFFMVELVLRGKKWSNVFFTISLTFLILSHNITAFFGFALIICYFIYRYHFIKKSKKIFFKFFFSIALALLITSFFWFSAIYEAHLTKLMELTSNYKDNFPSFSEIIYSPWGFGSWKQGPVTGKMSVQMGVVQELILIIALLVVIIKKLKKQIKKREALVIYFFLVTVICLFFTLQISSLVWEKIFFIPFLQFPWRLVGYIAFCSSVISAYFIDNFKRMKIRIILFISLLIMLFYSNRNHIRVNLNIEYRSPFLLSDIYIPSTTSNDEHMPKLAPRVYEIPPQDGEIFNDSSGSSKRTVWKSNFHQFKVILTKRTDFRDNTSYFPGWVAFVDGKEVPIKHTTDQLERSRVEVPAGNHTIEFRLEEIWYRKLFNFLSIIGLIILFCTVFIKWRKRKLFGFV